ncbi:MAG: hypothetical protein KKH83_03725 [Candidatus Margulisbacteria bacterium]|nr:hypothetical protein [Candidatus Margulisiibacteriota bacterium]
MQMSKPGICLRSVLEKLGPGKVVTAEEWSKAWNLPVHPRALNPHNPILPWLPITLDEVAKQNDQGRAGWVFAWCGLFPHGPGDLNWVENPEPGYYLVNLKSWITLGLLNQKGLGLPREVAPPAILQGVLFTLSRTKKVQEFPHLAYWMGKSEGRQLFINTSNLSVQVAIEDFGGLPVVPLWPFDN